VIVGDERLRTIVELTGAAAKKATPDRAANAVFGVGRDTLTVGPE
jgi:hypothetical protein